MFITLPPPPVPGSQLLLPTSGVATRRPSGNSSRKETLLSAGYSPVEGLWEHEPLVEEIDRIAAGSFKDRNPPEIAGTGYVVHSLEAALWAFHRTDNFREGALLAANLGDDADTTAAIYGLIAGAYYGASGIPAEWREQLTMVDDITSIADDLFYLAIGVPVFEVDKETLLSADYCPVEGCGRAIRWSRRLPASPRAPSRIATRRRSGAPVMSCGRSRLHSGRSTA